MRRLYEYFYELLKMLFFISKKFEMFVLQYKDGKPNYKNKSIERKMFKKYTK